MFKSKIFIHFILSSGFFFFFFCLLKIVLQVLASFDIKITIMCKTLTMEATDQNTGKLSNLKALDSASFPISFHFSTKQNKQTNESRTPLPSEKHLYRARTLVQGPRRAGRTCRQGLQQHILKRQSKLRQLRSSQARHSRQAFSVSSSPRLQRRAEEPSGGDLHRTCRAGLSGASCCAGNPGTPRCPGGDSPAPKAAPGTSTPVHQLKHRCCSELAGRRRPTQPSTATRPAAPDTGHGPAHTVSTLRRKGRHRRRCKLTQPQRTRVCGPGAGDKNRIQVPRCAGQVGGPTELTVSVLSLVPSSGPFALVPAASWAAPSRSVGDRGEGGSVAGPQAGTRLSSSNVVSPTVLPERRRYNLAL